MWLTKRLQKSKTVCNMFILNLSKKVWSCAVLFICFGFGMTVCVPVTDVDNGNSISLLDHLELLSLLDDSTVYDRKIGQIWRRGVKFPETNELTIDLPVLPDGSRFTCALAILNKLGNYQPFEFEILAVNPQGETVSLETRTYETVIYKQWLDFDIDLDGYTDGESDLKIVGRFADEGNRGLLGTPRLEVPRENGPQRIILVCIDTLRTDRMGCYGSVLGLTPVLDSLAEESVRFENCQSASPWTLPSVASVITGRYPGMIGATRDTEYLHGGEHTLAEIFHEAGFRTASIIQNRYTARECGFFQGYDAENDSNPTADIVTDSAIRWVNTLKDDSFFLYIHYFDPHVPYTPPEPYLSRYRMGHGRWRNGFPKEDVHRLRTGDLVPTEEEKLQLEGLYNGEIAFNDHEFRRFIDYLKEIGIWDDTAIVLYADHGEEFWEHGGSLHGRTVYQEVSHVPLFFKFPGFEPGVREDPVSLVDIFPTILDYADIELPGNIVGQNILSDDYQQENSRTFIIEALARGFQSKGIVMGDWKQILHFTDEMNPELYNLTDDPLELNNVLDRETDIAERLIGELFMYAAKTNEGNHVLLYPTDETGGGVFTLILESESGIFSDIETRGKFTVENIIILDHRIIYEVSMRTAGRGGGYLGLDFYLQPEDAEVTFSITHRGNPEVEFPWHLGGEDVESVTGNEFTISMTDHRVAMSFPQVRRFLARGLYIWCVPPSLQSEFESRMSPETAAELEALGYLH